MSNWEEENRDWEGTILSSKEASDYLGISRGTLANWRYKKIGPPYYRLGKFIQYKEEDLINFINGCKVDPTQGAPCKGGCKCSH